MPVNDDKWTIITADNNNFGNNLTEVLEYFDLLVLFVKRDITAQYKQTILGPLWFFIQPILTTLVFTIIFGKLAKLPTDGIPYTLFYFSGIIMWNYFAQCASGTSGLFRANSGLFSKVYFPRLIIPLSVCISALARFFIRFGLFMAIFIYYYWSGFNPSISYTICLLPLLILHMGVLGFSTGVIISSLTTKYFDLAFLVGFGLQLWMYASPIAYPVSMVPEQWNFWYFLNPMASIIHVFKYIFFNSGTVNWELYAEGVAVTLFLFILSLRLFSRVERTFIDTV